MKVICIYDVSWFDPKGNKPITGPQKDEIVTVESTENFGDYMLLEYKIIVPSTGKIAAYHNIYFRELNEDELAQESLVEQAKEIIKERELIEA